MSVKAVLRNLLVRARNFGYARGGNVAITFALSSVSIIGMAGAAVDYSRANAVKADLQAALDSTALMLSKEASTDTASQLQNNASNYFNANFTLPGVTNIKVTPTYTTTSGTQIALAGSVSVPTDFVGIVGLNSITVTASSTVKWGMSRLRVALVLDNTGSMSASGKIGALKTATDNLLTQLSSAATNNGDVYVSIVPFANDVNIGSSYYGASYIDWTDWNANNGTCRSYSGRTAPQTQSDCSSARGTWTADNHNTWNGCVTDRGPPLSTGANAPSPSNYDETITAPVTGNTSTMYPADQNLNSTCTQPVMGLNYNWSSMTSLVNSMQPGGSTNQPIGLVWGWQTLVGGGPFTSPAMDPNYTYSQVIILLSDGLNTQDRWYGNGSDTSTQVDSRMYNSSGLGTCANIKAAGITIYTIQVNTGGDPTSTLLQNCASDSSKFFLLTSASQIVTTFNAIGTNLSNLYVSK